MILFYVKYQIKEGKSRENFFRELQEADIIQLTRDEAGNKRYDFSYSAENPDQVCLAEVWERPEALAEHKTTDQFFRLQEIKGRYVQNMDLTQYEVR